MFLLCRACVASRVGSLCCLLCLFPLSAASGKHVIGAPRVVQFIAEQNARFCLLGRQAESLPAPDACGPKLVGFTGGIYLPLPRKTRYSRSDLGPLGAGALRKGIMNLIRNIIALSSILLCQPAGRA